MLKQYVLKPFRKILGTQRLQDEALRLRKAMAKQRFENRRNMLIEHILHDTNRGVTDHKYTDHDIIVSLTTYGKRIHDVAFTIESVMQQSLKANRIVLWLDYSFEKQRLPQSLQNQQKRGLEICYCKDLRSYKKLIPSLQKFPHDAIVTLDDDLLYEYDLLEHLICSYLEEPRAIQSCRGHQMLFDAHHQLLPYNSWNWNAQGIGFIENYFLTGGGGTLYPPDCLDSEVTNADVFLDICPYADDVWFNAMALKKGTKIRKVYTHNPKGDDYLLNDAVQDMGLWKLNNFGEHLNDKQIKAVFTKYSLYEKLK